MESPNLQPKHLVPLQPLKPQVSERRLSVSRRANTEDEIRAAADPLNYIGYWYLVKRNKGIIFRFAIVGFGLALLMSLLQTPMYRARTSLQIPDFNEDFMDTKHVDPTDPGGNYITAESYFETQIKILQSDSLIERVIGKLHIHEATPTPGWHAFTTRVRSHVRRILNLPISSPLANQENLIQQAQKNLTVHSAGNTRLLEVLYESPDPKLAAEFANTLVNEFIDQSQEMRWKSTQRTSEWLTSHLGEMKSRLEHSEGELQNYARTSGLVFTGDNENLADARLKELQDELSKAQADRIAKEAAFDEAKNRPVESLPETLDDPTLRDYRGKLTELQRQLAELTTTLTPAHYKVKRVQAQIEELQAALQKQRGLILHRIRNEYMAARKREAFLEQACAEQEKVLADQSSKAIHYDTLKRDVDSSRHLYEAMLERVKQAQLASAMRVSNVLVVDPAKPPAVPVRPRTLMNCILGLFGGTFCALAFVLLRENIDRRIRTPGDTEAYLSLPELGAIPLAGAPGIQALSKAARASHLSLPSFDSSFDDRSAPELSSWISKPSLIAECVRNTLTSILLAGQNGDFPQVLVLTSPCRGDGKTTVSSNLALAIADIGRKILLIDGDLRSPRLHKIFELPNDYGLSNILAANGPLDPSRTIAQLAHQTKIPGLTVLTSGSAGTNSVSLLYSPRMCDVIGQARRNFDMVVIDAPPMTQLADARVLARLADGVILILRAGQTTPRSAQIIAQRFVEDGTRVFGTVLNGWDPDDANSYSYYGAKEYLQYGYKSA